MFFQRSEFQQKVTKHKKTVKQGLIKVQKQISRNQSQRNKAKLISWQLRIVKKMFYNLKKMIRENENINKEKILF
jgi:hypothetical protein